MSLSSNFKTYFSEVILVNCFIFQVLASSISSEKISSIIIKILSSAITALIILINIRINGSDFKKYFAAAGFKKFLFLIVILLAIFSLTLIYSKNAWYGLFKIISFITGAIPSMAAFYYLMITISPIRIKIFFLSITIESIVLIALILILNPFYYDGQEIITATRWSHVIFGHFIGTAYILFLLGIFRIENKRTLNFLYPGFIILFIGVCLSGLRSAFAGLLVFTIIIFLINFIRERSSWKKILGLTSILFLTFILITLSGEIKETIHSRYGYFVEAPVSEIKMQSSVKSRIRTFEKSLEIISKYPFTGVGLGGFNNYNNDNDVMIYPHNILLEFTTELGIPGLFLFIYLLYIILKSSLKISWQVMVFFCFALWMALFSKDIPSNVFLWLGLAFYPLTGFKSKTERIPTKNLENVFITNGV